MSRNPAHAGPHPLNKNEQKTLEASLELIDRARAFAVFTLLPGRERSIVLTKLDEAALWTRRAIELGTSEVPDERPEGP